MVYTTHPKIHSCASQCVVQFRHIRRVNSARRNDRFHRSGYGSCNLCLLLRRLGGILLIIRRLRIVLLIMRVGGPATVINEDESWRWGTALFTCYAGVAATAAVMQDRLEFLLAKSR